MDDARGRRGRSTHLRVQEGHGRRAQRDQRSIFINPNSKLTTFRACLVSQHPRRSSRSVCPSSWRPPISEVSGTSPPCVERA